MLHRAALVDLVALHRDAGQRGPGTGHGLESRRRAPDDLGGLEHGDQRQQPEPRGIAFDRLRIDQRFAQHLQPAADAEHRTAVRGMPLDGRVQALRAQPAQVGAGVLGAGQHDPVGTGNVGRRAGPHQAHAGQVLERLELVEVAHARIGDDGDRLADLAAAAPAVVENAILVGQAVFAPHRQRRHGRHAGQVLQHLRARGQQRPIAAELVQHEAVDSLALAGLQQRPGTVQMREGPAAVDVGHEQAARLAMPRHPQVDDVAGAQVDLRRRAGALDHHHVVLGAQRVERAGDHRPDPLAALVPGHARQFFIHLAEQHHLAVGVAFGLEQQRIHAHVGLGPGGERLEVLRAADFAAGHHPRVVAHVLGLERRHLQAAPRVPAAQGRGQPALAGAAGRAQHHDAARRHRQARAADPPRP